MEFWCVNQKYFDSGYVKCLVYAIRAERKPENGYRSNMMCDEYHDYFDTYQEAVAFSEQVQGS